VGGLSALLRRFAPGERTSRLSPGAEGFGAFTHGGRGGQCGLAVTNLNDRTTAGPGSLRAAVVETPGPRTHRVRGVRRGERVDRAQVHGYTFMILLSPLTVRNAPGPGIMLRNYGVEVQAHDVVAALFARTRR